MLKDLFSLRGRIALVTGGSRGIGKMIAAGFLSQGAAKVYITARKAAACEATATELTKEYEGECIALPIDISSLAGVEMLAKEIKAREPKLDILVNNAGAAWGAPFDEFPESGWDKVMDLNVKSPFFMTQRVFELLEAAGSEEDYARVINIGSIEGMRTSHLEAYSYAASKAAILHLTRMMAKYLANKHITVNAIAPGYFPSKMTDAIPEEESEVIEGHTPMRRWGRPEDMAGVALYLASKASGFVCGAVIPVDGGLATTG